MRSTLLTGGLGKLHGGSFQSPAPHAEQKRDPPGLAAWQRGQTINTEGALGAMLAVTWSGASPHPGTGIPSVAAIVAA